MSMGGNKMRIIKYKKVNRTKVGAESDSKYHEYELEKQIPWSEANEEFAKAEAYNGEYEIYDDGVEDIQEPTKEDKFEAQLTYTAMMTGTLLEEV